MLRWIQLRILLGDHPFLLLLVAFLALLCIAIIFSILSVIVLSLLSKTTKFKNIGDELKEEMDITKMPTKGRGLAISVMALIVLVTIALLYIPVTNMISTHNLQEYKQASTYLTWRKDKYTKFDYTPKIHDNGLFSNPQASVSFVDRDTGKSKTFVTTNDSRPEVKFLNYSYDSNGLLFNVSYTNGHKYLIYKHYVAKHKLNNIQKAVYNDKNYNKSYVSAYVSTR